MSDKITLDPTNPQHVLQFVDICLESLPVENIKRASEILKFWEEGKETISSLLPNPEPISDEPKPNKKRTTSN